MSIMRVPAISAPGRGYAQPGNRGFTGWRTTTFGALGYSADDLSAIASANAWQRTSPSPRPAGTPVPAPQFMATVPTASDGNAPGPTAQTSTVPVATDVTGASSGAPAPSASCKPCTAFKFGALLVVVYAIYKAAR